MSGLVTRFAPSPTGLLHLGHALSAITGYDAAAEVSGRFLLRIEDIDTIRSRPAFEQAIFEDLSWLGLTWETPVRRQSEHIDDYQAALARLRHDGLLYRCFRTRKALLNEIVRAPHSDEARDHSAVGPLPEAVEAHLLAQGRPFAWRLSLERAAARLSGFGPLQFIEQGACPNGEGGLISVSLDGQDDVVLARKDLGVAYHLAVVVDDALQGVTHVVRGQDLFAATHVQRVLQALLDLPTPVYRHHRLVLGPDGQRLAKRDGAASLRTLRDQGVSPAQIRAGLAVGPD